MNMTLTQPTVSYIIRNHPEGYELIAIANSTQGQFVKWKRINPELPKAMGLARQESYKPIKWVIRDGFIEGKVIHV
jgi:hypothetical protein